MGEKNLVNQLRNIICHGGVIAGWANGHFKELSMQQLREMLQSYLLAGQFLKQRHLQYLLEVASKNNRLITGFWKVYENIINHRMHC